MSEDSSLKRTRASGEVLEYLLKEFEVNQNPSTDLRKEISEHTGMSEKAVRIWFQNRRAKLRKLDRLGKNPKSPSSGPTSNFPINSENRSYASSRSNLYTNIHAAASNPTSETHSSPLNVYSLIDCSSLSVGSWQRVKTGNNDPELIRSSVNLAPFCVKRFMSDVDLLVVLSRKNNEINYFFSATTPESRILFRVFYPVSAVLSSSLMDNSINKDEIELRINLEHKPQFSVYFYNGIHADLNQWSICEDFSEGQQVSNAFYSAGGDKIPHVLVGTKPSLEVLQIFLMENSQETHPNSTFLSIPSAPLGGSGPKPGQIHESQTPTNSDTPYGHSENRSASNTKDFLDLTEDHRAKNDFQIKHDIQSWSGSTPGDLAYELKPEFENHEPKMDTRIAAQNNNRFDRLAPDSLDHESFQEGHRKPDGTYSELFTETPDFFSSAATPNNMLPSHNAHQDNLIHTPSSNIHSYTALDGGLDKGPERRDANGVNDTVRRIYETLYPVSMAVDNTHFEGSGNNHYGFDIDMTGDYQHNADSPALSNAAATPNAIGSTNHVDTFIDYNGNA